MFQRLLVPLDGSPFAEHALATAALLAKRTGAVLHLVRVHQIIAYGELAGVDRWETEQRQDEAEYLDRMALRVASEHGVRVHTALLTEPVVAAICDYAMEHAVDLIVMSTHGRTGFSRAWLGSVADGVMHHAPAPVLMLRPKEGRVDEQLDHAPESLFRHLVLPLDGSPLAEQASAQAGRLGSAFNSRITIARVVHPVVVRAVNYPLPYPLPMAAVDHDGTAVLAERARTYVNTQAGRMRLAYPELTIETDVRVGERTATLLLDVAAERHAGTIVMATHGRGATRVVMGSVADKLLRGGPPAMLVYRPHHD